MENQPFCRFCQDPLPDSSKEVVCRTCKRASVPLTEKAITITPKEVKAKLDGGRSFIFLDVRWPHERGIASIQGTVHIPLSQLEARLSELPKGKEIVIHCRTGGRSRFAAITLLCNGFSKVKSMAGGINQWGREVDHSIQQY